MLFLCLLSEGTSCAGPVPGCHVTPPVQGTGFAEHMSHWVLIWRRKQPYPVYTEVTMSIIAVIQILFLVFLLPTIGLAGSPDTKARALTQGPGSAEERGFWQYSVGTNVNLVTFGIRDKAGGVGAYRAVFAVTSPDRRQYSSVKDGSGTAEVAASFPVDFGARWIKGVYTWTCAVGKKTVAQGSFEYCDSCSIPLLRADVRRELSPGY